MRKQKYALFVVGNVTQLDAADDVRQGLGCGCGWAVARFAAKAVARVLAETAVFCFWNNATKYIDANLIL